MTDFKPVQFVDTDAQRIEQELIVDYQRATGQALYPGDPRRFFLLQMLPVVVALKNDINFTGNSNLLPFAFDEILDALGSRINAERLLAQFATVTMKFILSAIQPTPVSIPVGTRVTPDGEIYFSTSSVLTIPAGTTEGMVETTSTLGGEKYNGFVAGQINLLVDPVPFVVSVSNIDTSLGGSDEETDEAYRERQRLAPASFSVAGPEDAYIFFAKSADVNIIDVAVTSPSPNVINIYPLMKGGALPTQAVLDKVLAQVSPKNRRPLNDQVSALVPTEVTYTTDLTYYIAKDKSAEESSIRAAVEGVGGAADLYEIWQYSKLGRAITPDDQISRIYAAGAYRVVPTSPVYTEIAENEVAKRTGVRAVTYGGLI
ncbi:baseplate assembly protein [Paenibacillus crassostreae]|uniref:Uncharacterized protein n=1 Tax=Paenibacillus crassostreae TaxID=1763538 RepID=A0A167C5K4_9BACL|nr:baseplate J/gp47 family protein [Paenibacillus crassostreae]AOZ91621.1 hypothetical protein LPB68_04910 [Paenibacillus crassostreae]OAB72805.1 hypothetical protein PNBC_15340 [Paenibacillus crassostreae]